MVYDRVENKVPRRREKKRFAPGLRSSQKKGENTSFGGQTSKKALLHNKKYLDFSLRICSLRSHGPKKKKRKKKKARQDQKSKTPLLSLLSPPKTNGTFSKSEFFLKILCDSCLLREHGRVLDPGVPPGLYIPYDNLPSIICSVSIRPMLRHAVLVVHALLIIS